MLSLDFPRSLMAEKSLLVTYVLWLTLGAFGVHHLYLGRDRHAFVWFWTMGGCCGVGWFMDAWRLPEYVDAANGYSVCRHGSRPLFSWKRFMGEIFFSLLLGDLGLHAIPDVWFAAFPLLKLAVPTLTALGVYVVANIGDECCPYSTCFFGACSPVLPLCLLPKPIGSTYLCLSCLVSALMAASDDSKSWKPVRRNVTKTDISVRICVLSIACLALMLASLAPVFHRNPAATLNHEAGKHVAINSIIRDVRAAPPWTRFPKMLLRHLVDSMKDVLRVFQVFISHIIDPSGELNAYMTLGLSPSASFRDVTRRYQQLRRLYQLDLVTSCSRQDAEHVLEWFAEIQSAYILLTQKYQYYAFMTAQL